MEVCAGGGRGCKVEEEDLTEAGEPRLPKEVGEGFAWIPGPRVFRAA